MNYFLFEDEDLELDLVFTEKELHRFREQWEDGISVANIARRMRRKPSEIALLVFDHAERDLIKRRASGLYGL